MHTIPCYNVIQGILNPFRFANMIIFENTVAQLAGRNDISGTNSSLSETIFQVKEATSDPIVIKVPLYEGLRLQSLYQRLQQTISDMKTRFKEQSAERSFAFRRTKKALWQTFRSSGCKLSASGDLIRENLKALIAEHPDLGVALWSLNHDDLTHICSDRNLYFTNLMFDEVIPKIELPPIGSHTRLLEMTPTGPQLLIMQDPNIETLEKASRNTPKATNNKPSETSENKHTLTHSNQQQLKPTISPSRKVSKEDAKEIPEGSRASYLQARESHSGTPPRIYSRLRGHNSPHHIIMLAATPSQRRKLWRAQHAEKPTEGTDSNANAKSVYEKVRK